MRKTTKKIDAIEQDNGDLRASDRRLGWPYDLTLAQFLRDLVDVGMWHGGQIAILRDVQDPVLEFGEEFGEESKPRTSLAIGNAGILVLVRFECTDGGRPRIEQYP